MYIKEIFKDFKEIQYIFKEKNVYLFIFLKIYTYF